MSKNQKLPFKYNLKPDKRSKDEKLYKNLLKAQNIKLPSEVNLIDKFPPIISQGNIGSCQSCALDSIVSYRHNNDFNPSPLFTYYNLRKDMGEEYINQDCGGTLIDTLNSVKNHGICDSKYWQYDILKFADEPSKEAYDDATARKEKDGIHKFYRVESIEEMKVALANDRPIYIGITVSSSFESEKCMETGIIPAPSDEILGGHAMSIVAFKDKEENSFTGLFDDLFHKEKKQEGYIILRNSWGTKIPDENGNNTDQTLGLPEYPGYFKISYQNFMKILIDAWVIVD
ncbi:C1 family peptidase [Clostridium sp. MT-14]|uniref:C1 family peptidase n=1 Tax=Clostridium sp. MT-14 TaxID=3348360 RepID=UPI0035F2D51E